MGAIFIFFHHFTTLFHICYDIIIIGESMKNKIFKNLDEQIDILRSRGLVINDVTKAKEILFRENYFFVSGYRHIFMNPDLDNVFLDGTTFDELYSMFVFDRGIRNIIFKYLLVIENNIKSIISYQMSRKYGFKEKDYLNPKNFNQDAMKFRQVKDILAKMRRQIRVNGSHHTATMHYLSNYGYIPMWILVKVLSFGIVSELYTILKYEDQLDIANFYKLDVETLSIYLSILANFRNICAHEDILYDYKTQKVIPDTRYHALLNIEIINDEYQRGKNDLFAIMIMLKQMLSEEEFRDFAYEIGYEIDLLDGKVNSVPLANILQAIGFPENWRDVVEMK